MGNKGLTISLVFEASSANYGEGLGNISTLKKMTRGDGNVYTYISRQALRYNMIQNLKWDNTPVEDAGVVQFAPSATIKDYPEIDLFGYMKTTSKKDGDAKGKQIIRSAAVRLSNAVSLEPYNSDLDFLTNMGLAKRAKGLENAIAQSEIHMSFYAYTITVDLERIGVDDNYNINLSNAEKAERITKFLEAVQFLNRDIKGREENLNPVFAIGGIYDRKNPYFEGRVRLIKHALDTKLLGEVINSCDDSAKNTKTGYLSGIFKNNAEVEGLGAVTIGKFFDSLKKEVENYYA